jgi:hypothetical protein
MKSFKTTGLILFLIISILCIRCTPNQQDYSRTTREIISTGKWSIDYYFSGQDKTSQYQTILLTFLGNGTVNCEHNNTVYQGQWASIKDVNRNDVLELQLNSQEPTLTELNVNWNVVESTPSSITMRNSDNTLRIRKQ